MPFLEKILRVSGTRGKSTRIPLETHLHGQKVWLRVGDPADWHDWRLLRSLSTDFLTPWEPTWPTNALEYDFFCGNLRRHWREWREDSGYAFMVFHQNALVGGITLNDIQRGVAQKGTLGYWIGKPYANQGFMSDATATLCHFAFTELNLHRVEASCLPHNGPSKALLKKLAFEQEGFARKYLRINGQWEDHLLWSKTVP